MSVSETMAITLTVTGCLSVYLILHALLDLYRMRQNERDDT